MTAEAADKMAAEFNRVIEYFRNEFDVTYAETIGLLNMAAWRLTQEAYLDDEEEPDA